MYQSSILIHHTVINQEVMKLISGIFKNSSKAKTIILPERYRYYHLSHRYFYYHLSHHHFYYHLHHHKLDQYFIIFNLITLLMMVHMIVISAADYCYFIYRYFYNNYTHWMIEFNAFFFYYFLYW